MKPTYQASLTAAVLVAIVAAGCKQQDGNVAQKDDQSSAQQAPNQADKIGGAAVALNDASITTKVKAAIVAEPTLSALDIKVNTVDGVVTLSGTIDNVQKFTRAQQVAQAIDGVKSVNNELALKTDS